MPRPSASAFVAILSPAVSLVVTLWAAAAWAEPKYVGWTKVEAAPEVRGFRERLREGGQFDKAARDFFEGTVLPQLALEENRPVIERTRKRIRDLLLGDVADENSYAEISQLLAGFMTTLARDEEMPAVVRVNAMLLVGELKAKDGKPWPRAAAALAEAAGDGRLSDAVRIAALAGLARHVAAATGDETVTKTFGPPLTAILAEPVSPERAVAHEWLVSRALSAVPLVFRQAPPQLAATLAGLAADEKRSIDVRVRAAAALGATADEKSGVDAAAVIETIRKLAVTALEAEEKAAEVRRFEAGYRGGGPPGAMPMPPPGPGVPPMFGIDGQPLPVVDPTAIQEEACRRAAWRLSALGTAIFAADDKPGLAKLLGEAGAAARDLAKQLVDEAGLIDRTPEQDAVLDALDVLRPPKPGEKSAHRAPKAGEGDEPAEPGAKPAAPNASPFDSPFK